MLSFFCLHSAQAYAARRAEECGVELYKEIDHESCGTIWNASRTDSCGVEAYNSQAGEVCGVDQYKEREDPLCGIKMWEENRALECPGGKKEEYWSDWGKSCPVPSDIFTSIISLQSETRIHRVGISVTTQMRHKCGLSTLGLCRNATYNSCRLPENGIESYKTCQHSNFGVSQWHECRHQNHGREAFTRCRKPEFGVELFQACEIKKTTAELNEYLEQNRISIPNDGKDLLQFQANFYKAEQNQAALGCLISRYQDDPIYSGLSAELQTQYKNAFNIEFARNSFTTTICTKDQAVTIKTAACADADSSVKCGNLRRYQENLHILKTKNAEILELKNDVVPRLNAAYSAELDNLVSLIPQDARN